MIARRLIAVLALTVLPAFGWWAQAQQQLPTAPVAQRAVLYEEDVKNPQGRRYVGTVVWRTETVTAASGSAPDLAVRADVAVPERGIELTFLAHRNTDPVLPASHTIELTFKVPGDSPIGGIQAAPGILMKSAEAARGTPLTGLSLKGRSGFFRIALSPAELDMKRNLLFLKELAWFDIPIIYNGGQRAILALEKGTTGEDAFEQAFKAWGQ